jgi:N-acetylglucosaminyldiphosphoundecaprenol N-acetyl-beta-D-mannosaminyltransferase
MKQQQDHTFPTVSPAKANILGVGVSAINMETALSTIDGWIAQRSQHYVCVTPVHGIVECQFSEELRHIYNHAGLVTPDGMPIVWLSRRQGYPHVQRVYGPDLMLALCAHSIQRSYRHYFYGGGEGVAEDLAQRLTARFPGLQVTGASAPPFRPLTDDEDATAVAEINASDPDIVWVGLGAPKQEYWMASHVGRLSAPALIGVGAAFDFHTGRKQQAPRWMQRSGLEWLFRLASEPRRLWKRYLVYNSLFVGHVLLQTLGVRNYPLPPDEPAPRRQA